MKKLLSVILSITLLCSLMVAAVGCGAKTPEVVETPPEALDDGDPYSSFSSFPKFKARDIHGNEVTDAIFQDYKLTLVNLWATNCRPCIAELPDLELLHQEMKAEGVNIVGIVADGMVNEEIAKSILEKTSVTYTNIIPDSGLMEDFVNHTMWVPVSVLVDSDGNMVGKSISGARSKDEYQRILQETLKALK